MTDKTEKDINPHLYPTDEFENLEEHVKYIMRTESMKDVEGPVCGDGEECDTDLPTESKHEERPTRKSVRCWFFHKWSRWSSPQNWQGDLRQSRRCHKCYLVQERRC